MSVKSLRTGVRSFSLLAGNVPEHHVLLAESTVGAGGTSAVTFSNIPADYQHLQIRYMVATTTTGNNIDIQFNGDTGTNYSWHQVIGNGTSATSNGGANSNVGYISTVSAVQPIVAVADILDYANTSKFKTVRSLAGVDENGAGTVMLRSSAWRSTSAVSSIRLGIDTGLIKQYSTFQLYGVK